MKKSILTTLALMSSLTFFGQWNPTGDNSTTGTTTSKRFIMSDNDTDLLIYRDNNLAGWSLLRSNLGSGIGLVGKPDDIALSVLRSNSFVGIGTSDPQAKLHLNGDLKMNAGEGFKIYGDTQYFGTNLDAIIFEMQDVNASNGNTDGGFVFRGHTLTDQVSNEWMVIKSGGKVGIGTSAPQAKLHLNGDLKMNAGEGFRVYGDTQYFGTNLDAIIFEMQDVNASNGNTDGGFVFRGHTLTDEVSNEWMVIKSGGKVGIGTTNPDSKLTVKGKIHCEEVQVDLQVPADYVFEKYYTGVSELKEEYSMPTLAEVEAFTKENYHLPNIPSATEIKEEGLHLKEMTNLLLQKIEEITLYTIEQQKEINELKKQIKN